MGRARSSTVVARNPRFHGVLERPIGALRPLDVDPVIRVDFERRRPMSWEMAYVDRSGLSPIQRKLGRVRRRLRSRP
jgi:hypothetical protein